MKKYIIMFLMSFILQDNIQCADYKANLNKAIQVQLISARKVIGNVKLSLDLDVILDASVSYAKRGNDQSIEVINVIKDIENALQKYRSDQYTFWINTTILLGYDHPKLVTDSIDPAIKRVIAALKKIEIQAKSYGYVGATALVGAVLAASLAAAAVWFFSDSDADAALLKEMNVDVKPFTAQGVAQQWSVIVAKSVCREAGLVEENDIWEVESSVRVNALALLLPIEQNHQLGAYDFYSSGYNQDQANSLKKELIEAARNLAGKIKFDRVGRTAPQYDVTELSPF